MIDANLACFSMRFAILSDIIMEDRWISVEEIAKYLGVSRDTVYKWIDQRHMPAHRIGRLWKFKKDEVSDWGDCPKLG